MPWRQKGVLPLPRIESKFFGILYTYYLLFLILPRLSNGVFNSNTIYVQMVFEADAP